VKISLPTMPQKAATAPKEIPSAKPLFQPKSIAPKVIGIKQRQILITPKLAIDCSTITRASKIPSCATLNVDLFLAFITRLLICRFTYI